MISRTKEFVKISNIIGSPQNPGVKGLPRLAPVQPCGKGLIIPVAEFFVRFPYPARRGVITRSEIPRFAGKQSPLAWASHPWSFPHTRESRLDPESESGVTNGRQSRVPRGTVPPMRLPRACVLAMTSRVSSENTTSWQTAINVGNAPCQRRREPKRMRLYRNVWAGVRIGLRSLKRRQICFASAADQRHAVQRMQPLLLNYHETAFQG